jgi:protein-tyrosine-phosphatase
MVEATVVFVCTGNTCRSPLAMALARRAWPETIEVTSAGLQAHGGDPAAEPAREVARERGADLSTHRARALTRDVLVGKGWIIGMTRSHVAQLAPHLDPAGPWRLGLMAAPGIDLRGQSTPEVDEIADPIGGDLDRYRLTADQIAHWLEAWTPYVVPADSQETI